MTLLTAEGCFHRMRDEATPASPDANCTVEIEHEDKLAEEIEHDLHARHGTLLGGAALYRSLGFPTAAAMRQAFSRGKVPVPVFEIPDRRGRFARTRDVALWLARCMASSQVRPAQPIDAARVAAEETDM